MELCTRVCFRACKCVFPDTFERVSSPRVATSLDLNGPFEQFGAPEPGVSVPDQVVENPKHGRSGCCTARRDADVQGVQAAVAALHANQDVLGVNGRRPRFFFEKTLAGRSRRRPLDSSKIGPVNVSPSCEAWRRRSNIDLL